jgi:hypothetical protein
MSRTGRKVTVDWSPMAFERRERPTGSGGSGRRGRRVRVLLVALATPAAVALYLSAPSAPSAGAAEPKSAGASARGAAPKKVGAADAGSLGTRTPAPAPAPAPVQGVGGDAGLIEARTLDGGTRVFKFKELDIEGRLKSPQLVYFLRRVRAEFAAEELGHRTFLPEMSETRKERSF